MLPGSLVGSLVTDSSNITTQPSHSTPSEAKKVFSYPPDYIKNQVNRLDSFRDAVDTPERNELTMGIRENRCDRRQSIRRQLSIGDAICFVGSDVIEGQISFQCKRNERITRASVLLYCTAAEHAPLSTTRVVRKRKHRIFESRANLNLEENDAPTETSDGSNRGKEKLLKGQFAIRIPEHLPPSIRLCAGPVVAYKLRASVALKSKLTRRKMIATQELNIQPVVSLNEKESELSSGYVRSKKRSSRGLALQCILFSNRSLVHAGFRLYVCIRNKCNVELKHLLLVIRKAARVLNVKYSSVVYSTLVQLNGSKESFIEKNVDVQLSECVEHDLLPSYEDIHVSLSYDLLVNLSLLPTETIRWSTPVFLANDDGSN